MRRYLWIGSLVLSLGIVSLGGALPGHSAAQDARLVLEFWHSYAETGPQNALLVETLIPQFEAAFPGVRVQPVAFPPDDFRRVLLAALASGDGPDLARIDARWTPELADLGYLAPLDRVLPDWSDLASTVFPSTLAAHVYGDHAYGLPVDATVRLWAWNRGMYGVAGLDGPPATFGDLLTQCTAISDLDEPQHYLFGDDGSSGATLLPWLWSYGAVITDPDLTQASGYVNSPQTAAAFAFLLEMVEAGCFGPAMFDVNENAQVNFFSGTTAATLGDPAIYAAAAAQPLYIVLEVSPFPAGAGGSVTVAGGHALALPRPAARPPKPEHTAAALDLMRFLVSDEVQRALAAAGMLPVKPALAADETLNSQPGYAAFMAGLVTARPLPPHPAWARIDLVLAGTSQRILSGEVEPLAALDDAALEIDAILAEYQ